MMVASILVLLAAIGLCAAVWAFRGSRRTNRPEDLQALDLDAFLNLMDRREEEYLRAHLQPAEFRKVQRKRLSAAVEYVSAISRNAGMLLQVGEAARRSEDRAIAESGQRLVDSASQVRLRSAAAMLKLRLAMVLPGTSLETARVVESYRQITDLAGRLGDGRAPEASPAHGS